MALQRNGTLLLLVLLGLAFTTGCGELEGFLDSLPAEGEIQGESFRFQSGTAERTTSGYTLTLSNSRDFTCSVTPSGQYLTVVAVDIQNEGRVDAPGNVTFNQRNDEFGGLPLGATSGFVSIDRIDNEFQEIEGYIDAQGDESAVRGDFLVPICP